MKNNIKFCLLLGSFNCSKDILQQLQSIHASFLKYSPSKEGYRCLFFDDGSADNSVDLINTFFKNVNVSVTRVCVNKADNISGKFYKLFTSALVQTNAEIFFFADGDDIWSLNKVSLTAEMYAKNNFGLLLSGVQEFDGSNNNILPNIRRLYIYDLCCNVAPGMSYAVTRSELSNFIDNEGKRFRWHDHGFFLFSKYISKNVVVCTDTLQLYRKHHEQYTHKNKMSIYDRFVYILENLRILWKISNKK
jgi:glycosyltransferase involved in cell wall biosynthesis